MSSAPIKPDISDDRVFYVSLIGSHPPSQTNNPIAIGIHGSPSPHMQGQQPTWGYITWFDKLGQCRRAFELIKAPLVTPDRNCYQITTKNGSTYRFQYVDKKIYDQAVRVLFPYLPEHENTEEIQKYLQALEPESKEKAEEKKTIIKNDLYFSYEE